MRHIDDAERRSRLGHRHGLAPGHGFSDPATAARALAGLHGTDPVTVYLSALARVGGMARADLDTALYVERSLVKQLCMRRTLFVLDRELLAAAVRGPGQRVAAAERRKTARDLEASGVTTDGARWLRKVEREVLAVLEEHDALTTTTLRQLVPRAGTVIRVGGPGKWGQETPIAARLLTILSAAGLAVRGPNDGNWNTSRPVWTSMAAWLGEPLPELGTAQAYALMARAWLRAFAPGTLDDLKWWLGSTVSDARAALVDVGAVEVTLDRGGVGYVLPDDVEEVEAPEPWAALLPALDPTTMGWSGRDWYLGAHRNLLFDANGNAGPTAWWCGRIIGGWHQETSGEVVLNPIEKVPQAAVRALRDRADELTSWLAGERVLPRFPTPLFRDPSLTAVPLS